MTSHTTTESKTRSNTQSTEGTSPAAVIDSTRVHYDFSGQVALVTGASAGMGRATAHAFARAGAAVALLDLHADSVQAAARELTDEGLSAIGLACDVADEDAVAGAVRQTVQHFGRLDMAFNNAGIQAPPTDAADEPAELFDRVNAVNLRGIWASMKHELV